MQVEAVEACLPGNGDEPGDDRQYPRPLAELPAGIEELTVHGQLHTEELPLLPQLVQPLPARPQLAGVERLPFDLAGRGQHPKHVLRLQLAPLLGLAAYGSGRGLAHQNRQPLQLPRFAPKQGGSDLVQDLDQRRALAGRESVDLALQRGHPQLNYLTSSRSSRPF